MPIARYFIFVGGTLAEKVPHNEFLATKKSYANFDLSMKVKLIGKIKPAAQDPEASTVTFDVHLGGPALFGPIGMLVAGALKGDIRASLDKFKSVFAP